MAEALHPSIARKLQHLGYTHLPPDMQVVSRLFYDLAYVLIDLVPHNADLTLALEELIKAKDNAVRATLP